MRQSARQPHDEDDTGGATGGGEAEGPLLARLARGAVCGTRREVAHLRRMVAPTARAALYKLLSIGIVKFCSEEHLMTVDTETHRAPSFEDLLAAADRAATELRSTAAERDRANGTPRAEVELLRETDLLQVQEPVEYGGAGLNYAQAAQITRRIARGDTSIAHLIGYHYAQTRVAPPVRHRRSRPTSSPAATARSGSSGAACRTRAAGRS